MALLDERQIEEISQLVNALDGDECRKLFYLCGRFDFETNVTSVKDFLESRFLAHENGNLFLVELTWRLARFDILKRLYKISRNEVEETLKYNQVLSRFRVLMISVCEDLNKEDLDKIKFLLSGTLPREKIRDADTFLDVLIELEKLGLVSPERVEKVQECFMNIRRVDLAKRITAYQESGQHTSQQQSYTPVEVARGHPQNSAARVIAPLPIREEAGQRNQVEQYKFNSNPRGVCVIIDCVGFDGEMLEQTFNALHFKVIIHKWLDADKIYSALEGIFGKRENHLGDVFVCCIISCGTVNHLFGMNENGSSLPTDHIRQIFTAKNCSFLVGKPKLFFIQTYNVLCTQMTHESIEVDGCNTPNMQGIPSEGDIFWSHCWTQGSQLEKAQSSIYLRALGDVLHKARSRKTHLVDAHLEVNRAIFEHNKRNAGDEYHIDLRHTLRKNLFLS